MVGIGERGDHVPDWRGLRQRPSPEAVLLHYQKPDNRVCRDVRQIAPLYFE
jgi:hypothetical protein